MRDRVGVSCGRGMHAPRIGVDGYVRVSRLRPPGVSPRVYRWRHHHRLHLQHHRRLPARGRRLFSGRLLVASPFAFGATPSRRWRAALDLPGSTHDEAPLHAPRCPCVLAGEAARGRLKSARTRRARLRRLVAEPRHPAGAAKPETAATAALVPLPRAVARGSPADGPDHPDATASCQRAVGSCGAPPLHTCHTAAGNDSEACRTAHNNLPPHALLATGPVCFRPLPYP